MATTLKNIAIVGAAGSVGAAVFEKLVASGHFNVTVLRRQGSSSTFAAGTKVVDVDFSSLEATKEAITGQDAVIAVFGNEGFDMQTTLIEASVAAGVKRFLPSEFGSDLSNPNVRKLPVFTKKVAAEDLLAEKAKTTSLTYTIVYNSALLDWGLQKNFLLNVADYKPTIYDGGDSIFSSTTLSDVGTAVVGILLHPEETKNRSVYVESAKVSQNKLLALAKKVAPEKPWAPQQAKLDDITAAADARLAQKLFDHQTFIPYIFRAIMDPKSGSDFQKTDNELLGVKGVSDEYIESVLRPLLS